MHKFDQIVLRELSTLMLEYFPDQFISITQVHVSKDMSFAKVWISCKDDVDKVVLGCKKKAGLFRDILSKTIVARKVPKLYFVADYTADDAQKIEDLISNAHETD